MKLKTLLLGSAAAMIAVTGARAADAVIAEPEPVEFVRVCDLYGAGFFYIPGTETCLKFDGYVRVDYTYDTEFRTAGIAGTPSSSSPTLTLVSATNPAPAGSTIVTGVNGQQFFVSNTVVAGTPAVLGRDGSSSRWDYRARFNIDARNETDFGTLRSQIRFQGDGDGGGDAAVGVDRALISLAGLRVGYSDSFTTTFHGYGNPVEKYDGYYGYDQAIFLDYTFKVAGFEVAVGVQDSTGNGDTAANPHVNLEYYAGIGYGNDFGRIAASYIYEEAVDEGAYKVSAEITAIDNLVVKGWFIGDESGQTNQVEGANDYAWGVGASYQFLDTMAIRAAWTDTENGASAGTPGFATVGLQWDPVPGLSVRPEVAIFEDDLGQEYSLRVYRTF